MITIETFEPDKQVPYRVIEYRGHDDKMICRLWLDTDNRIARIYLHDRRSDRQPDCVVLFGADHANVLGIQEFIYDNLNRLSERIEYEVCDGKKIQIQKLKYYYDGESGRNNKTVLYGRTEEPVGYMLSTYDDAGIAPMGMYNMNHEPVDRFNLERLF